MSLGFNARLGPASIDNARLGPASIDVDVYCHNPYFCRVLQQRILASNSGQGAYVKAMQDATYSKDYKLVFELFEEAVNRGFCGPRIFYMCLTARHNELCEISNAQSCQDKEQYKANIESIWERARQAEADDGRNEDLYQRIYSSLEEKEHQDFWLEGQKYMEAMQNAKRCGNDKELDRLFEEAYEKKCCHSVKIFSVRLAALRDRLFQMPFPLSIRDKEQYAKQAESIWTRAQKCNADDAQNKRIYFHILALIRETQCVVTSDNTCYVWYERKSDKI